jgi:hypothetical protein
MDSKKIEELLNRYWSCETSLEEEAQLREYFQQDDIPEQHREAAALFRYFGQNKKKSIVDAQFDEKILHGHVAPKRGKVVHLARNAMRIAAGIAVLLIATWFVRVEMTKDDPEAVADTYDDPKLAFEETKKALMMISKGFAQAETEAKKINLFNEAREEIQKGTSEKGSL